MTIVNLAQIKVHFDYLYPSALEVARLNAATFVENLGLTSLECDQRVLLLHREIQNIRHEIKIFAGNEYIYFATSKTFLYKIYASRMLFYETNDEAKLRQAFILNERHCLLQEEWQQVMNEWPGFSFESFLQNGEQVVLWELNGQPEGISWKDYQKIRNWQTSRQIECVTAESRQLRQRFRLHCQTGQDIWGKACQELRQWNYIYRKAAEISTSQFITELLKLQIISEENLPDRPQDFHAGFCRSAKGDPMWEVKTPGYFDLAMKNIREGIVTKAPVCCLSFCVYAKWLSDVIDKKTVENDEKEPCYDSIFESAYRQGMAKGEEAVIKTKRKLAAKLLAGEDPVLVRMVEFYRIWDDYQQLKHPEYYYFLEDIETLRCRFNDNCCLSLDSSLHREELIRSIVLDRLIVYLREELSLLQHNALTPDLEELLRSYQIVELIGCMMPDKALIDELFETIKRIGELVKNERIPHYFIQEDIKHSFNELFRKGLCSFKEQIEISTKDSLPVFIISQISDIEYMENLAELDGYKLHEHFKQLKKYFKHQLHNIQDAQKFKQPEMTGILQKKEKPVNKPISFGYQPGPKELKPILTAMNFRMNLLTGDTTVEELMEVLMCEDLSKCTKRIHLGLKINLFNYWRKKLKPWCRHLTPARIEQSGVFISWKEGPITAHVLYNSKVVLLEDMNLMDSIFSAKYNNSL